MLSTLILTTVAAQSAVAKATTFEHLFTKDQRTTYAVDISGSEEGNDINFKVEFDLTPKSDTKEGKTDVAIKVLRASASFGGQEMPMDGLADTQVTLDKFGAPTVVSMNGMEGVLYVTLLTQYLPAKSLKVGESFKADLTVTGGKYSTEGTYAGDEALDGKTYAVIKSKSTFTPDGQEEGTLGTKSFFDPVARRIVRTESTIMTPDGEFKMVITTKKA